MIPIAIYHCNISIVSRGKGKSAVAAAAYRSGEKLTNEWDGMTHDYTRKGGVVHTEIMLPPHAPPSFSDRSTLWNSVELYEKAGNAQLAREIDAALPIELSREEQIRLVREYCSSQFVSRGMCVDYAIHDTGKGNPHCHIMLTMRPLDERGAWAAKSKKEYDLDENGERIRLPSGRYKTHKVDLTGWNDKGNAPLWRKAWADLTNDFLERNGSPQRIDHRSNAERGIDEIPTVHMGVAACQMEKKGIATEKGELNRNIQKANRLIREIRAQIGKLKEWIGELFKARETAPEQPPQSPGLANLLIKYMSVQREKSRKYSQYWQRQHTADELKTVSQAVNFLAERGISTLAELDAALSSVSEPDAIREGMKTAEKRMKELQKLIEYGKNYSASVASTVLRTEVNADSKSMEDLTAAVPSASTGVVSAAVRPLPVRFMASLTEAHFLPNAASESPAFVHADSRRARRSVALLICASVCLSAPCALLRFVRAFVTASALFCSALALAASWPSSFLTSAEDCAYSSDSASRLALAAMVAESDSPSVRAYCSYCRVAAAT